MMSLKLLFEPRSVLLIGSSRKRVSQNMVSPEIFSRVSANIGRFAGKKYIVDVEKTASFPEADTAFITLPPADCVTVLERIKVKFAVILPGGFSTEQVMAVKGIAKRKGFRVLGPNSVCGVLSPLEGLNSTFERDLKMKPGSISVVSQSGGVGATLLDMAEYYSVGISRFVWVGNMIDITETEILEYLAGDAKTKVIMMYLEGIKAPRKFMEIARHAGKRIMVIKGGVSEEAKERAQSHTASLSSESSVYSAAFRQSGIKEMDSMGAMFNRAMVLDSCGRLKGKRIAVISNTGGASIMAADWCFKFGMDMAKFSEGTKRLIRQKYPGIEPINPLDIIADADGRRYKDIVDTVVKDPTVDGVIVINQFRSCIIKPEELEILKRVKTAKPIIDCAPGAGDFAKAKFFLGDAMPVMSSVKNAVKSMAYLWEDSQ